MSLRETITPKKILQLYSIRSGIVIYSVGFFIIAIILVLALAERTKNLVLQVVVDHTIITKSIVSRLVDSAASSIDSAIALHGALPSDSRLTGVSLPNTLSILSVISSDGWLIASTGEYTQPIYLGDRRHFEVHSSNLIEPDAVYIGPPVLGRVSGLVTLQLTRATRHDDGSLKSVFVASYVLDDLTNLLDELPTPHGLARAVYGSDRILRSNSGAWSGMDVDPGLLPGNFHTCRFLIFCSFYSISLDDKNQLLHISMADNVNMIYEESNNIMGLLIFYFIVISFYFFLRDVHRFEVSRSRAEQVLKSAKLSRYASLGQMAAAFAHEVGTPAQTISLGLGNLRRELSVDGGSGAARTLKRVERMEVAIKRIANLSGALRRFSQPGDRRQKSLGEIVTECSNMVDPILKIYSINVHIDFGPHSFVKCSNEEIQTIVINLIDNARDAMLNTNAKVREIYINWESVADETLFRVRDTGGGIADDIIDRIFDPLFSTKADGSGIGLALVSSIIKRLGGKISASNDAHGAVFEVYLPALVSTENPGG